MIDAETIVKIGAKLRQEYKMGDIPYGPSSWRFNKLGKDLF